MKLTRMIVVFTIGLGLSASVHAAFTANPGPDGGLIDDFDEASPDTVTWKRIADPSSSVSFFHVSHVAGTLKLETTVTTDADYSTVTQKVGVGEVLSVEMTRTGNGAIGTPATGLLMAGQNTKRSIGDAEDYIGVNWQGGTISALFENDELGGAINVSQAETLVLNNPYRFEVWRVGSDEASFRVIDIGAGGGASLVSDLNEDGGVDISDFGIFAGLFGCDTSVGSCSDADLNTSGGSVDISDFGIFASEFGQSGGGESVLFDETLNWSDSSSGTVDDDLFIALHANRAFHDVDNVKIFTMSSEPHLAPEPGTTMFLLLGMAFATKRRRG